MIPGILTKEYPVPGMGTNMNNKSDLEGYSFKCMKADMDDLAQMSEYQNIITRGLTGGDDIRILARNSFTFLERMFLIVDYLEKNPE
jgi:hypothetical protein